MGISFRKSFTLFPGLRINLSKSGPSISFGIPGASATINTKGHARLNCGAGPFRYRKDLSLPLPLAADRRIAKAKELFRDALRGPKT